MKCEEVLPLLELLGDSELDSKDSALVIKHLDSCSTCQNEWRQVEQLRTIFKLARENTIASTTLAEKIDRAISTEKRGRSRQALSLKAFLGLAASVLWLGFIASVLFPTIKTDRTVGVAPTTGSLIEDLYKPNQFEPIANLDQLAQRVGYQLKYVHLPDWKMQGAGLAKISSPQGIARFSFVRTVNGKEQKLSCYQGLERSIRCNAENFRQEKLAEKVVAFGYQGKLTFALWSQNGRDYLFVSDMPEAELKKVVQDA